MRANNVLSNHADIDQRLETAALHFDPFSDGFAAVDLVIDLADEVFDPDCDRCEAGDDEPRAAPSDYAAGDDLDAEDADPDCCRAFDDCGGGLYELGSVRAAGCELEDVLDYVTTAASLCVPRPASRSLSSPIEWRAESDNGGWVQRRWNAENMRWERYEPEPQRYDGAASHAVLTVIAARRAVPPAGSGERGR